MMKNNQKGFTFIELMIVIAIIGILTVIATPKIEYLIHGVRPLNTNVHFGNTLKTIVY